MPPKARKLKAESVQDGNAGTKVVAAGKGKGKRKANDDGEEDNDAGEPSAKGLSDQKLPLPAWLKMFTERGVDMRLAMTLAGKL